MRADDILVSAAGALRDRAALRDQADGERSMARAVNAFNTLTCSQLTEADGWLFMCVLKLARSSGGVPHLDDYTDLAGYAALAGECVSR